METAYAVIAEHKKQMESISKGITEGAEDVRFVLDRISQLNKTGEGQFPLKGRIDLSSRTLVRCEA